MGELDPVSPIELALLGRIVSDRNGDGILDLESYQALYPGHEELIAKVYARITEEPSEASVAETQQDANYLAHFRLIRRLGQGGQGIVWLAEDERLQRQVALKVLTSHFGLLEKDEQALIRARFEREAAIAARLDDPGLCKVFEVGESDGWPWSSMQYIEGESLDRVFKESQQGTASDTSAARSNIEQVVRRIEAAARAIHVAHEAGLVHRDLKPANIMLTPSDRVIVLDFGIARDSSAAATLTATGESIGSPAYMAPEQILGMDQVDRRTDVYALGVTLYEGLTGQRPFDEPTRERLFQQIRMGTSTPIRQRNSNVSADLAVVIACAMDMAPERRYRDAMHFAEDLARVLQREPIHARPASVTTKLVRWTQRNPIIAGLAAAVFVLVSSVA
ncbi:MAG: serine/threonine protein kinase, partial [Planctomycetota bacterium]